MPRKARDIYDGGVYHVLNRGHNKQSIFINPMDYFIFRKLIKKYLLLYKINIYNYVIMPNHFHLLLKVIEANHLSKFMQGICQTYAQYYRSRHEVIGCIFQNRYKCIAIKNNQYLLECARYIERNPLRAGLALSIDNYQYSSYNYYSKGGYDGLVTTNPLFLNIGKTAPKRHKAYTEYVNTVRPYEEIIDEKLEISR